MWLYALSGVSIGLAGSVHCIGMCGPLAMAMPWSSQGLLVRNNVSYHLGRTVTYMMLGLCFGWLGNVFYIAGHQQALSIAAGLFVGLIALSKVLSVPTTSFKIPILGWFKKTYFSLIGHKNIVSSPALFGMVNGLLPCGLVYIAVAAAMSTGQLLGGIVVMATFGLGTMPLFFMFLLGYQKVGIAFRGRINRLMPYLVLLSACLLITRGLNLGIPFLSPELNVKGTTPKMIHCAE